MEAHIRIQNVNKVFTSGRRQVVALQDIDLDIAPGQFTCLLGPSGCGKSTLMKLISGFERPDAGGVRIDGEPLLRPGPKGIVISQHGSVFPWLTVQENLMFGLNEGERAQKARLAISTSALNASPARLSWMS